VGDRGAGLGIGPLVPELVGAAEGLVVVAGACSAGDVDVPDLKVLPELPVSSTKSVAPE
jgi:hypothetical protein